MSNIINGMGHTFVEGLIESQRSKKRRATKVVLMPNQFRKVHNPKGNVDFDYGALFNK